MHYIIWSTSYLGWCWIPSETRVAVPSWCPSRLISWPEQVRSSREAANQGSSQAGITLPLSAWALQIPCNLGLPPAQSLSLLSTTHPGGKLISTEDHFLYVLNCLLGRQIAFEINCKWNYSYFKKFHFKLWAIAHEALDSSYPLLKE